MPLFQIERSVEMPYPAETVWKVISEFQDYHEWNPFVVQAKCDLKPGAPIDMMVKLRGKVQRQVEEIVEVQPGYGFSYRMKPMPLGALSSFRSHFIQFLRPGHCRYHSHFEIKGWLVPVVLALFKESLEQGFESMTQAIGDRAEQLSPTRIVRKEEIKA